jgi:CMP-N,N'-diacetyllegionaminic acid synthase
MTTTKTGKKGTIAIIPARGGSKGIPRKNIKELCGKPLIAHIIETSLCVKELDRVIVSTEDEEIVKVALQYGAEVILRPAKLAGDDVPTLPVLQHVVSFVEDRGYFPDNIILLYPTSPLLRAEIIRYAIKRLCDHEVDSVMSVVKDRGHYWVEVGGTYERLFPKIIQNRQFIKPLYKENGAIYASTRRTLMDEGSLVGPRVSFILMDPDENIDIDEPCDFELAERRLREEKLCKL